MNITQQRARAVALLLEQCHFGKYSDIDYAIDTECRKALKLSPRPEGSLPYVGWMIGEKEVDAKELRVSIKGIELIKRWEGCKFNAYLCPAGVWTIGYGHTKNVRRGMHVTQTEANGLLAADLVWFEQAVRDSVTVPLTQGQFDALVSFTFNVGVTAFRKSTLFRLLNAGKHQLAALQFHRWVYANKKKLPGLVSRRNAEYDMFVGEQ